MQRPIKFRAWLKSQNRFILFDYWKDLGKYGWDYFFDQLNQEKDYTPELQQYTGLKDSKNREIYEGDIIAEPFGANPFVVEWGVEVYDEYDSAIGYQVPYENSEVIGNIYENPELLENKK